MLDCLGSNICVERQLSQNIGSLQIEEASDLTYAPVY